MKRIKELLFGEIAKPVESHYSLTIPKPSTKEELVGFQEFIENLREKRNEIYDILHK